MNKLNRAIPLLAALGFDMPGSIPGSIPGKGSRFEPRPYQGHKHQTLSIGGKRRRYRNRGKRKAQHKAAE